MVKKGKNRYFYVVFDHYQLCPDTIYSYSRDTRSKILGSLRRSIMSKPMTKTQLVAALADEMGSDKKSAGAALDAVCSLITREVSGGGAVTLPGVGKIQCRARPERMSTGCRSCRASPEA